jgi:AcrR family transcriptional regulator
MSPAPTARRRGARAEVPITQEAIVEAAHRLIEERGPEGFSMRSLATELGVFPATIYWHVGDRAQLLGIVQQRWMSEIVIPDDIVDWREWMIELAHRYRRNAHRSPNVARLVSIERARNIESLAVPDAVIGRLAQLGLGDQLVHAYNAVVGAVQGFVVMELTAINVLTDEENEAARRDLTELDPEQFPHITAHRDELIDRTLSMRWSNVHERPLDESFDFLLRVLLDGLSAHLPPAG